MRTRTREVYEALCQIYREIGRAPTIRQIGSKLNLTNGAPSTMHGALQELVALGLVEKIVPTIKGLYVPVLPPDKVDWEALAKGDGDGRKALESS